APLLGDGIELGGAAFPTAVEPGDTLPVTLGWRAGDAAPAADYTAFVQLLGPSGLVAQSDAYPTARLEGRTLVRPTSGWVAGEVVGDHHILTVPLTLPPGDYRLIAGLYDLAQGGARLPATLDGRALADAAVPLGAVRVR
ncbi:MAG: hypothetical protein ACRDIB_01375, partial [Ardenticatenaceae bacterium]